MQHKIIANLEKSILLKYLSLDEINISLPHSKIYFSLDQEKVYYKRSKRKLAKCLSNLNKHYGYNFASGDTNFLLSNTINFKNINENGLLRYYCHNSQKILNLDLIQLDSFYYLILEKNTKEATTDIITKISAYIFTLSYYAGLYIALGEIQLAYNKNNYTLNGFKNINYYIINQIPPQNHTK